jgi:hypothetical protein
MVRDPRGVAYSFQKHAAKTTGLEGHIVAVRAAVRWLAKHLTNEAVRRRYGPQRWLLVRYERFVDDPRHAVEAVAKMLGASPPLVDLSPGIPITVPEVHGPDGSRWRRFVGTEVILDLDDQWQKELHPVDRVLVTLLTYPLLRRYGYPIRTRRRDAPRERDRPRS